MDPNENLKEQREIAKEILEARYDQEMTMEAWYRSFESSTHRLAELSQALDEWLVKGGFLPSDWDRLNQSRLELEVLKDMANHPRPPHRGRLTLWKRK